MGTKIDKAVIAVPPYFTDNQRQATKDAGTIAGLHILRIINEPTAAGLAYKLDKITLPKYTIVFDMGGSSCCVSLLLVEDGIF